VNKEINVGDVVEVVNDGLQYTTYPEWADKYGLVRYVSYSCKGLSTDCTYKVVAKAKHLHHLLKDVLLGIENDKGEQFIIGIAGVKKVETASLPEKFILKSDSDSWLTTFVNGEYHCEHTVSKYKYGPYTKEKVEGWLSDSGFTIDPIEEANGTDGNGKPLNFTKEMLKPLMRVKTKNGGMWVVVPNVQLSEDEESNDSNDMHVLADLSEWLEFSTEVNDEYQPIEVYEAPVINCHMLVPNRYGNLVWKAYATGGEIPNVENNFVEENNSEEPVENNFEQRLKYIEEALAGLEAERVNSVYVSISSEVDIEAIKQQVYDGLKRRNLI
jgi:hypothetical protein